ncbi:OmpA family protein [Sphingomonas sp. 2R-10]|uniref:OmpA family protein n=1 Tax=Sphingomonas sp. 2R-10 TaxID=3045148 RepID=UPI000F7692BA|nr:OmpA family protein [Sphingomonas sp. 2R-10]MDJ0276554.1 OmpA family protein [Sphingomonas sp. 2R-10]
MRTTRFDTAPGRPLWLTTLADISLLLVGFFVFLQAAQAVDRQALTAGIRAGFDAEPIPMTLERAMVDGFAPGSAALPGGTANTIDFVREAAADHRIAVTLTGGTDSPGSDRDVDPATGSAAILATDRARAVAALLVREGAVTPAQIAFATPGTGGRGVHIDLGFAGDRQAVADRQAPVAVSTGADR